MPPWSTVAVAVTAWPPVTATPASVWLKAAKPAPSVVTLTKPRNTSPSPWPLASPVGELKNSMRKVALAVLCTLPAMVVLPPVETALVSSGVFCRSLGPMSASLASFGVGPSQPRSMPGPPLLRIALRSTALPVLLLLVTATPCHRLNATRLPAPAAVPPIMLLLAPAVATTPLPLARLALPLLSVPMKLPATVLALVPLPFSSTPA